jgi:hypothetical protein
MVLRTGFVVYWRGGRTLYGADAGTALMLLGMNVAIVIGAMLVATLIPAPPDTNRRLRVAGSRFDNTPLPASLN